MEAQSIIKVRVRGIVDPGAACYWQTSYVQVQSPARTLSPLGNLRKLTTNTEIATIALPRALQHPQTQLMNDISREVSKLFEIPLLTENTTSIHYCRNCEIFHYLFKLKALLFLNRVS